jgi:hypothetical protein
MNDELKFKVGDVWKMLAGDHTNISRGATFKVLEVDNGDAWVELGGESCYVYKDRIEDGELVLVERKGVTMNNAVLSKRELIALNYQINREKFKFESYDSLSEFIGRSIDLESAFDIVRASAEADAKIRVMHADALLAELAK